MQSVLIYVAGGVLEQIIGVLISPVTTRLLSPEQFGIIALVSSVFAAVSLMQLAGMDWAFPYFRIRFNRPEELTTLRNTSTYIATTSLTATGIVFLLSLFSSVRISDFLRVHEPLSMVLVAAWLFFYGLNGWYVYILRYENLPLSFIKVALNRAIVFPLVFLPAAWLAPPEARLDVYFGSSIAALASSSLHGLLAIRRSADVWPYERSHFSFMLAKEMLGYGLVLVPSGVLLAMISVVDRYLLGWLSDTGDIGVYYLAVNMSALLVMIRSWFNLAWWPFIIEFIKKNPREVYEKTVNQMMYYASIVFSGVALVLGLWAAEITSLIYPAAFNQAAVVVPFLLMSGVLGGLSSIANVSVVITQKKRFHPVIYGAALALNIGTCILLIPAWGVTGAAIGMLASDAFILVAWILVTNYLTDALRLRAVKPLLLAIAALSVVSANVSFSFSWEIRSVVSFAMGAFVMTRPETFQILRMGKKFPLMFNR